MEGAGRAAPSLFDRVCEGLWKTQNADMDCFLVILLEAFQGSGGCSTRLLAGARAAEVRWRLTSLQAGLSHPLAAGTADLTSPPSGGKGAESPLEAGQRDPSYSKALSSRAGRCSFTEKSGLKGAPLQLQVWLPPPACPVACGHQAVTEQKFHFFNVTLSPFCPSIPFLND